MKKQLVITLLLVTLCPLLATAQLPRDVFPLTREFKKGGFYVSPQLTYTIGYNDNGKYIFQDVNSFQDSTYVYDVQGSGKLGFGAELGWFHSFEKKRFIQLLEAGVAYRIFKGEAKHDGVLSIGAENQVFSSDNKLNTQLVVASLRAKTIRQLGKYSFLSSALGLNYNYKLSESLDRSGNYPILNEKSLSTSSLQVHFQIGVGFRFSRKLIVMPTIETPLLLLNNFTASELGDINPAFPYFGTKYHPLIFGITFQFIREDPENCNAPVYKPLGQP